MTRQIKVLIVDDEIEVCNFFRFLLLEKGYEVVTAYSGKELTAMLLQDSFELAFVDLRLLDTDGIKVLEQIKAVQPDCRVILMTGYSTVKTAVDAIKLGAYDYIEKPFEEIEELESLIDSALDTSRRVPQDNESFVKELFRNGIICSHRSPLVNALALAKKIASKNIAVLIQGETGVGKEVVARYIHSQSLRTSQPFIAVNCAAFTESLLESELFGHEKGSFTGAQGVRKGIFQIADGGTLFLDEVGNASPAIQAKLLRVLECGEFLPVGGEKIKRTDVRVISATNVSLIDAVAMKQFREDLYYRLNVLTLDIPPLRERKCDVEPLVNHFAKRFYSHENGHELIIEPAAIDILINYPWPGNVRELANVMAQAAALAEKGRITPDILPDQIKNKGENNFEKLNLLTGDNIEEIINQYSRALADQLATIPVDLNELSKKLKVAQHYITKRVVQEGLRRVNGNRVEAAEKMNCTTRVLRYYLNERD
ncbi:two component, sigma54 specific, transcriptional regulator, Fis family [Desulforamulus reducens MI-1]|uniref:Stage 0 sporulation protein A homolog n=1 Tax=Desulforamulus reducens (strain ATCC BAA-1160 / DSM 100696 / MI-1) TaxID=349161 RepID=A4J4M8_DESRM|nr:sigma-54 dependent transcriptional regulator [Desulforamulus reducens]ABO50031.1 two component, sigma54 specific, transcriptional regulator, Fis family [Desulforamulus reducens MI-1]